MLDTLHSKARETYSLWAARGTFYPVALPLHGRLGANLAKALANGDEAVNAGSLEDGGQVCVEQVGWTLIIEPDVSTGEPNGDFPRVEIVVELGDHLEKVRAKQQVDDLELH